MTHSINQTDIQNGISRGLKMRSLAFHETLSALGATLKRLTDLPERFIRPNLAQTASSPKDCAA